MTHPLRALTSYHYFKTVDMASFASALHIDDTPPDIFADCGAFSALTQNTTIDIDDYVRWLHEWHDVFTVYASLDVIGNAQATYNNLKYLESNGLKPLPVVHVQSPISELARYLDEYSYVAIGGMVGTPLKKIMPWLVEAFRMAKKSNTVYHGFGMTSWGGIKDLPWYSVDSSSWASGMRYGTVKVFDPARGAVVSLPMTDKKLWEKYRPIVEKYGFHPQQFLDRKKQIYDVTAALSMASVFELEVFMRKRHGLIALPNKPKPHVLDSCNGVRIYAANSAKSIFAAAAQGLKMYFAALPNTDLKRGFEQIKETK